jgi:hypothetical protein
MRLLILSLVFCVTAMTAHAGEITEAKVRALYTEMDQVFGTEKIDEPRVIDFYNRHLTDKSVLTLNLEVNVAPQPQTLNLDKQKLLQMIHEAVETTTNKKYVTQLTEVKTDPATNTAAVAYYQQNDGVTRQIIEGVPTDIDFTSLAACRETLIEENDVLILTQSVCNTKITYTPRMPNQ